MLERAIPRATTLSVQSLLHKMMKSEYAVAIFERMCYNQNHTEWKQVAESKGKGTLVSDQDRQEFREYLQFCIEGLKAGMTEDEIFAAWLAGETSVPKAG